MGDLGISFLGGLLLGSIPAAWILVRLHSRQDLATSGSTNVGALNALRVSRSKGLGVLVLVLDAVKGAAAVGLAGWLAGRTGADPVALQGAAVVGAVAGHNYNPWLSLAARRLVGGKGLAAAAGGLLPCLPWLVPAWIGLGLIGWVAFKLARGIDDEAPATMFAIVAIVPLAWVLYDGRAAVVTACIAVLVLPRLVREVRALVFGRS